MAPKFTQRHHRAVADLFWIRDQELRAAVGTATLHEVARNEWLVLQGRFRNLFANDNSRFKPDLFDRACGRDS